MLDTDYILALLRHLSLICSVSLKETNVKTKVQMVIRTLDMLLCEVRQRKPSIASRPPGHLTFTLETWSFSYWHGVLGLPKMSETQE